MKAGPDALGTIENVYGHAKHENGSRRPGTAENDSGSAKHKNGTQHTRYRQKRVRARKT
jgi:hypothetical protein